jgi:hypothetical protein
MNTVKKHTSTSPVPQSGANHWRQIEITWVMRLSYKQIRERLEEPYTDPQEVHSIMSNLNLLRANDDILLIEQALKSADLKLRISQVAPPKNIFFPLILGDDSESTYTIPDLIEGVLMEDFRY